MPGDCVGQVNATGLVFVSRAQAGVSPTPCRDRNTPTPPQCTTIKGLLVSIRWYLGFHNGQLGGPNTGSAIWALSSVKGVSKAVQVL